MHQSNYSNEWFILGVTLGGAFTLASLVAFVLTARNRKSKAR